MNNEIEFKFGDYAIIEQKRHGVPNEMFVHKVIDQLRSNTWVDVPVQSPATETLHDEMEDVCWCICCGVSETEVRKYRVKDMQRSNLSPDGGEVTALALTLEKSREASGCPAGVDLQDWVKQLAAENLALKDINAWCKTDAFKNMYREFKAAEALGCSDVDCMHDAMLVAIMHSPETPATERIVAEAEARGVEKFAKKLESRGRHQDYVEIANAFAKQLREGADK